MVEQNTKDNIGSLCIECEKNPKEQNDYCFECASKIIIEFRQRQARKELINNIKEKLGKTTLVWGDVKHGKKLVRIEGYSRKEVMKILQVLDK